MKLTVIAECLSKNLLGDSETKSTIAVLYFK